MTNMLALSDDGHHWRIRERCTESRVENEMLISTWELWPDVQVTTWLFFDAGWQVRVHRLKSKRQLHSAEAGHSVAAREHDVGHGTDYWQAGPGRAAVIFPDNAAGLVDPRGLRVGSVVVSTPNSNLLHPRTVLPTLRRHPRAGRALARDAAAGDVRSNLFPQLLKPEVELEVQTDETTLRLPSGRKLTLFATLGRARGSWRRIDGCSRAG